MVVGHVRNDQSNGGAVVVAVAPIHAPLMRAKAKRGIYTSKRADEAESRSKPG